MFAVRFIHGITSTLPTAMSKDAILEKLRDHKESNPEWPSWKHKRYLCALSPIFKDG